MPDGAAGIQSVGSDRGDFEEPSDARLDRQPRDVYASAAHRARDPRRRRSIGRIVGCTAARERMFAITGRVLDASPPRMLSLRNGSAATQLRCACLIATPSTGAVRRGDMASAPGARSSD